MTIPDYSFRQFQDELRQLDGDAPVHPVNNREEVLRRQMELAKQEVLALCVKYNLSLADLVAFFPEEQGIGFLHALLQAPTVLKKTRRRSDGSNI